MKNKHLNWPLLAALMLSFTSCLNQAKQEEAKKKSFSINEKKVLTLLLKEHEQTASAVTVFYLPNSAEDPGAEIENQSVTSLAAKRQVARTIVYNSSKISKLVTEAKVAGAILQSPKTQCVNLLTAYIGMDLCKKGAAEMEAGFKQIEQSLKQIARAEEKLANDLDLNYEKLTRVTNEIKTIQEKLIILNTDPTANSDRISALEIKLTEATKEQSEYENVELKIRAEQKVLSQKTRKLKVAHADLLIKKKQCESLPGLWAQLAPFHKNLPMCAKKKKIVDTNTGKAQSLGKEMVMAVGPSNWMATSPKNTKVIMTKDKIEIAVTFGLPTVQTYSTANKSIFNTKYNPTNRELSFSIEEKDQEGNYTGKIIQASLEKTAIDDVQKYTGSIKRYDGSYMEAEGKMVLEFKSK